MKKTNKENPLVTFRKMNEARNKTVGKSLRKAQDSLESNGGSTKATKFAALAPPYNKATFADRIVGAKKNAKKK